MSESVLKSVTKCALYASVLVLGVEALVAVFTGSGALADALQFVISYPVRAMVWHPWVAVPLMTIPALTAMCNYMKRPSGWAMPIFAVFFLASLAVFLGATNAAGVGEWRMVMFKTSAPATLTAWQGSCDIDECTIAVQDASTLVVTMLNVTHGDCVDAIAKTNSGYTYTVLRVNGEKVISAQAQDQCRMLYQNTLSLSVPVIADKSS